VELVVKTDLFALTRMWMGELKWQDAQRVGKISLLAPASLINNFPKWLKLNVFANRLN